MTRTKKLFLITLLFLFSSVCYSQANYLYKDKNWIFENSTRTGWTYSKSAKSDDGSIYYEFKHSDGSTVDYYFQDCNNCNPNCNSIIITDIIKRKGAYAKIFDEDYTKIGHFKWGNKDKNVFIEFDLDFEYMDILFIKIRPMY
jgi:hypothetical protein